MDPKTHAPRAWMILGPTASGKTALSMRLAAALPIEIISVDSALVYRGMDIGTAKPSAAERQAVVHHLIDIIDIDQSFSAADFREQALSLIEDIRARGHVPVLVGGTMLYAKALREGIDELPSTDASVRERIASEAARLGWSAMHARLQAIDPITAARLNPNDSQRIARALEVHAMTGRPISSYQAGERVPDASIVTVALWPADRARLHAAIATRFDAMLEMGFLDEVRALMAKKEFSVDSTSMRAVGYRQAVAHLMGHTDAVAFRDAALAATRQLAKRQITWLRSMPAVHHFDPYEQSIDGIADRLIHAIVHQDSTLV